MAYVYIRGPGWRHLFSCIVLSGPPADGTILHVVFYPDPRLTAHTYKKFLAGFPADGSQRVKCAYFSANSVFKSLVHLHRLTAEFNILCNVASITNIEFDRLPVSSLTLWTPSNFLPNSCRRPLNFSHTTRRWLNFRKTSPGARRFFESEKRRDPSRAFIPLTK